MSGSKKSQYIALAEDLRKHWNLLESDHDLNCLKMVNRKIFTYELIEDFGWSIPSHITARKDWFRIDDQLTAGTFGGANPRSIAWEDDCRNPNGEFLLCVSFRTGAYFFGDDYDVNFFKAFFNELKSFNPKFKDSENKALYFSKDQAGVFLKQYPLIVKRYRDLYLNQSDMRKAKKLREELEKLES